MVPWPTPADPHTHIKKISPGKQNAIYQRGSQLEAHFADMFLVSDPPTQPFLGAGVVCHRAMAWQGLSAPHLIFVVPTALSVVQNAKTVVSC